MGDPHMESAIAAIWCAILGLDSVDPDSDFFGLGADSLAAVRMLAAVEDELGAPVSFIDFVDAPTLRALALAVGELGGAPPAQPAPASAESERSDGRVPCSYAQESLWFLESGAATGAYNEPIALAIEGALDIDALDEALGTLVGRHEALRTTIAAEDGRPVQVVSERLEAALERIDLADERDPPARARELVAELTRAPFALERGPLVRGHLLILGPREFVLVLVLHHIITDGWSQDRLLEELGEIYRARTEGRPPELPELTLQYRDFVLRQRRRLDGRPLAAEQDFWRAELAGAPTVVRLPLDRPRPPVQSFAGDVRTLRLSGELGEGVRELARAERVTPYVLLMAVFATLLYRRSGQDDLLISGPMANREADMADVSGFFANTVVVRARLGGNPAFAGLLQRIRDAVLSSYDHQHVPLDLVVDALRPPRDPGINPLVQVNFRVRSEGLPVPDLGGVAVRRLPAALAVARFELSLELRLLDDGIEAEWGWSTALMDEATVLGLAADFERLLGQAIADPGRRLLDFELADTAPAGTAPAPARAGIRGFRAAGGRSGAT